MKADMITDEGCEELSMSDQFLLWAHRRLGDSGLGQ